jgi:hypothetical protein
MKLLHSAAHPSHLFWWQWGQLVGLLFPALLICFQVESPWLWALAAHFLVDFTLQSCETAVNKARGDKRVLAYHAFISGGYAGLIAGGLSGLVISVTAHYLMDMTNKFGLK